LDTASEEAIIKRGTTLNFHEIDDQVLTLQQQEADTFFQMGLIPKRIDVRQDALTPEQYAALEPHQQASAN